MKLCLVRHGETEENLAHMLQGHLPGRLSDCGKRQAMDLKQNLNLEDVDVIVSSDLKRVTDTVEIVLGGREDIPWLKTPLFREINWGSMTGMKIADVDFKHLAKDVETREMLYERAARARDYLLKHFVGKRVLVVSHGLFLRSLIAVFEGIPLDKLHTIPHMKNCECRWVDVQVE